MRRIKNLFRRLKQKLLRRTETSPVEEIADAEKSIEGTNQVQIEIIPITNKVEPEEQAAEEQAAEEQKRREAALNLGKRDHIVLKIDDVVPNVEASAIEASPAVDSDSKANVPVGAAPKRRHHHH